MERQKPFRAERNGRRICYYCNSFDRIELLVFEGEDLTTIKEKMISKEGYVQTPGQVCWTHGKTKDFQE